MGKAREDQASRLAGARPAPAAMLALAVAAMLAGCGPDIEIVRAPAWEPAPLPGRVAPIAYTRTMIDVPRFSPIGYTWSGWTCLVPARPVTAGETRRVGNDPELTAIFEERMSAAGFDVASARSSLFEEQGATRARFQVGARLSDLAVALCEAESPIWGIALGSTGELSLTADWEVFSVLERRVVLRVTTRGHARLRHASLHAAERLLQQAFAAATDNLAGDAAFRTLLLDAGVPPRLLGSPAPGTAAAVPGETIALPAVRAFSGALAAHAEDVRAAVVLLEGGIGHGSGFLVGPDGHVLTNAHVVGEAERIRVRLQDGRVRAGVVLRRDRVRDVALVRIPGGGYPVLPIRTAPVAVGETVHAIGAPLQPELYGTLTRGVVSALRRAEWDGQDYIQADVTIQGGNSGGPLVDAEGNVVGIAVSGIAPSPDRLSAGLNFFIPIAEALDRLGLSLAGPDGRDARG